MGIINKIEKASTFLLVRAIAPLSPARATKVQYAFYRRYGMNFTGVPNYISSKAAIDGTDYSLITMGEGATVSSYVRILTHDWAPHTVGKALGIWTEKPLGRISPVVIGDFSFVGTGTVIMPGAKIGRGCIIGAGTVVRGVIPDYSIVIGSPGQIIGDSRAYMRRNYPDQVGPQHDEG